jgi:hypothetical protein
MGQGTADGTCGDRARSRARTRARCTRYRRCSRDCKGRPWHLDTRVAVARIARCADGHTTDAVEEAAVPADAVAIAKARLIDIHRGATADAASTSRCCRVVAPALPAMGLVEVIASDGEQSVARIAATGNALGNAELIATRRDAARELGGANALDASRRARRSARPRGHAELQRCAAARAAIVVVPTFVAELRQRPGKRASDEGEQEERELRHARMMARLARASIRARERHSRSFPKRDLAPGVVSKGGRVAALGATCDPWDESSLRSC